MSTVTLAILCLATFGLVQSGNEAQPAADKRPTKVWTRVGPLGETPKHVTDAYPLSDQQNRANWTKFETMSDEFGGKELDRSKWTVGMSWWRGRQPALFSDKNVTVSDGKLHLTMRKEPVPSEFEKFGYHDYTSAALHTKARSSYGYYEVKAKPMNSGGSSSFWFQQDETPAWQTEIDVFEIGGKAKGFEFKDNMTVHIFRTPRKKKHWQVGDAWVAPWRLADDYHVYGLDWGKDEITYYVDGVAVRRVENTHWHQPLYLIFDSETMPKWFGMPEDADLPSTFSVEYVRTWKRKWSVIRVDELRCFPALILGLLCLIRDQNSEGGNGILCIATLGFQSQHGPVLCGKAQQTQDALSVCHDAIAVNLDFGLKRGRQPHELVGDSQMGSEDVSNADLATGDMNVLSHRN